MQCGIAAAVDLDADDVCRLEEPAPGIRRRARAGQRAHAARHHLAYDGVVRLAGRHVDAPVGLDRHDAAWVWPGHPGRLRGGVARDHLQCGDVLARLGGCARLLADRVRETWKGVNGPVGANGVTASNRTNALRRIGAALLAPRRLIVTQVDWREPHPCRSSRRLSSVTSVIRQRQSALHCPHSRIAPPVTGHTRAAEFA